MAEKRNWKQEIKEAWNENKGKIKIGLCCLGAGIMYGFVKGLNVCNDNVGKLIDKIPYEPDPGDVSDYIYANLDKPELLEEIRGTLKEIDELKED